MQTKKQAIIWACFFCSQLALGIESPEIVVSDSVISEDKQKYGAGASSTVIYPEQFFDNSLSIGEIIEQSAFVYTRSSSSIGNTEEASIRGFSGNKIKILLDGTPIADGASFNSVPLNINKSMIEKIIVVQGPQSSRHGSGAMGGIINIITRKNSGKTLFSASGGSFGRRDLSS